MPKINLRKYNIDDITTKPGGGSVVKSFMSSCPISENGHRSPVPDDLLPYAGIEDLRNTLTVTATRGTEALAALWCLLSPFQKLWLDPGEFAVYWAKAERADIGWRRQT
jgi:hypothetical protein